MMKPAKKGCDLIPQDDRNLHAWLYARRAEIGSIKNQALHFSRIPERKSERDIAAVAEDVYKRQS